MRQVGGMELLSLKRNSLTITAAINTLGLAPEQLLSSLEISQVAEPFSIGAALMISIAMLACKHGYLIYDSGGSATLDRLMLHNYSSVLKNWLFASTLSYLSFQ